MGQPPFQPIIEACRVDEDQQAIHRAKTASPEPCIVSLAEALAHRIDLKLKVLRLAVPESGRDGCCNVLFVKQN